MDDVAIVDVCNSLIVIRIIGHGTNYRLEQVEQAEWETFEAFALFPILKVGMAR